MSRIGKNARGVRGFVKKFARFAVLHTNGINGNVMCFYAFAHEEVAPVDVLRTLMVFGIISQIDRRFVVHRESGWLRGRQAEIGEQRAQVDSLFGCFGRGYNFCFAR
eukprot:6184733-Pleurochrysis_carterae.AAC.2